VLNFSRLAQFYIGEIQVLDVIAIDLARADSYGRVDIYLPIVM